MKTLPFYILLSLMLAFAIFEVVDYDSETSFQYDMRAHHEDQLQRDEEFKRDIIEFMDRGGRFTSDDGAELKQIICDHIEEHGQKCKGK